MGRVILPPNYPEFEGNLIFLAGPIVGAPKWQNRAISLISDMDKSINIASPSTRVDGKYFAENPREFKQALYMEGDEQIDWETFYLKRAAFKGAIMFWFANEEDHYCDRPYAQTSRFELGKWVTIYDYEKGRCKIAMGIAKGFSGEEYIKYVLKKEHQIHSSLEETCRAAVKIIRETV